MGDDDDTLQEQEKKTQTQSTTAQKNKEISNIETHTVPVGAEQAQEGSIELHFSSGDIRSAAPGVATSTVPGPAPLLKSTEVRLSEQAPQLMEDSHISGELHDLVDGTALPKFLTMNYYERIRMIMKPNDRLYTYSIPEQKRYGTLLIRADLGELPQEQQIELNGVSYLFLEKPPCAVEAQEAKKDQQPGASPQGEKTDEITQGLQIVQSRGNIPKGDPNVAIYQMIRAMLIGQSRDDLYESVSGNGGGATLLDEKIAAYVAGAATRTVAHEAGHAKQPTQIRDALKALQELFEHNTEHKFDDLHNIIAYEDLPERYTYPPPKNLEESYICVEGEAKHIFIRLCYRDPINTDFQRTQPTDQSVSLEALEKRSGNISHVSVSEATKQKDNPFDEYFYQISNAIDQITDALKEVMQHSLKLRYFEKEEWVECRPKTETSPVEWIRLELFKYCSSVVSGVSAEGFSEGTVSKGDTESKDTFQKRRVENKAYLSTLKEVKKTRHEMFTNLGNVDYRYKMKHDTSVETIKTNTQLLKHLKDMLDSYQRIIQPAYASAVQALAERPSPSAGASPSQAPQQ